MIKVTTTSNRKSIYSRRKIETLGLPFDIGLRTLDLSIWWSVWPIHVICALLVPDIICNACIKGLFEIDIISIDMQYFVTRNILYFTLFYAVIPIYFVRDCRPKIWFYIYILYPKIMGSGGWIFAKIGWKFIGISFFASGASHLWPSK